MCYFEDIALGSGYLWWATFHHFLTSYSLYLNSTTQNASWKWYMYVEDGKKTVKRPNKQGFCKTFSLTDQTEERQLHWSWSMRTNWDIDIGLGFITKRRLPEYNSDMQRVPEVTSIFNHNRSHQDLSFLRSQTRTCPPWITKVATLWFLPRVQKEMITGLHVVSICS